MNSKHKKGRRAFIKKAGITTIAGVSVANFPGTKVYANQDMPEDDPSLNTMTLRKNIKLQMQEDVKRALKKPSEERKWGMAIDLRKCIACNACTIACIAENILPPGVVYRPVLKKEIGTFPNVSRKNTPKPCMQCEKPLCIQVCPVHATFLRPDGIVEIDYNQCIGCRYCMTACPYEHRVFDFGLYYTENTPQQQEYEKRPSFEYGKEWERDKNKSPIGNTRKCTFCVHRLEEGLLPACVTTCIGGANYFGDLNDSKSQIIKVVGKSNVTVLKEEFGTEPKVFYLQ